MNNNALASQSLSPHYAISLFDEALKTVAVSFDATTRKPFVYKTYLDLSLDDLVICPVARDGKTGFVIGKVIEVHGEPKLEEDSSIDYKWIVQRVDTEAYTEARNRDLAAMETFRTYRRLTARRKMADELEALAPGLGEQIRQTLKAPVAAEAAEAETSTS